MHKWARFKDYLLNVYYLTFDVVYHFELGGLVIGIIECWGWSRDFGVEFKFVLAVTQARLVNNSLVLIHEWLLWTEDEIIDSVMFFNISYIYV